MHDVSHRSTPSISAWLRLYRSTSTAANASTCGEGAGMRSKGKLREGPGTVHLKMPSHGGHFPTQI